MSQFTYIGTELELFAQAKNWKNYIRCLLRQYIRGDVLEVGAGMGSNTKLLSHSQYNQWLCLEPDFELFQRLEHTIASNGIINCDAQQGRVDSLNEGQVFDSILYTDVLEHIEDDETEVIKATQHLKVDGNLMILGPAHQWLFTPFDAAIGHYRRYNKPMLKTILPEEIEIIKFVYLDCIGLLASLANKLVLESQPTLKQIKVWDQLMVPLSKGSIQR
jgi:2-polyprenyl-3-methyl-5-hydroxy-6-metoxy-1,4-benzoquinol methylase